VSRLAPAFSQSTHTSAGLVRRLPLACHRLRRRRRAARPYARHAQGAPGAARRADHRPDASPSHGRLRS
jgi:hypothetical protein